MRNAVCSPHVVPVSSQWGLILRASFLFVAFAIPLSFAGAPWLNTLELVFVSIVLEALPFMLLGSMVSGLIEVFVSKDRLAGLLPKRPVLLVFMAAGLGVIFPVCECAIVPVVRRFLRKGVPLSAAIAYLLAGPVFNPVVAASTAVAYSSNTAWQTAGIVAIRMLSAFFIAWGIGLIMGKRFPGNSALLEKPNKNGPDAAGTPVSAPCGCHPESGPKIKEATGPRLLAALNHGVDDFLDVTQYLVAGAFIAGLLQTCVSRQTFLELAGIPLLSIPLMMLLALILNLCSEADAFIASSFRGTLPLSAQMAFMVLGPMLDMSLGVFRKRTIVILASLVLIAVLAVMILLHFLLGDWYALPAGLMARAGP